MTPLRLWGGEVKAGFVIPPHSASNTFDQKLRRFGPQQPHIENLRTPLKHHTLTLHISYPIPLSDKILFNLLLGKHVLISDFAWLPVASQGWEAVFTF